MLDFLLERKLEKYDRMSTELAAEVTRINSTTPHTPPTSPTIPTLLTTLYALEYARWEARHRRQRGWADLPKPAAPPWAEDLRDLVVGIVGTEMWIRKVLGECGRDREGHEGHGGGEGYREGEVGGKGREEESGDAEGGGERWG